MTYPVRSAALIGRFEDPRVAEATSALLPLLFARSIRVLVAEEAPPPAGGAWPAAIAGSSGVTRLPETALGEEADLVIAIGGDGTLLYAARLVARVARHDVPLLGINRGRLGFLTDVSPQDLPICLDAALQGKLERDERPLLKARTPGGEFLALNDVVLQKTATGRMLDFETDLNGRYVNTHAGDGIVIASATGSTAYALSCGGPIVEPDLNVLVLAPICPHTLSDRPIVVSARSTIGIKLLERSPTPDPEAPDTRAQEVCDGLVAGEITSIDKLTVTLASERITLLHPPGYDYYSLLRSKLHWGRGRAVEHAR
jgi:NAD+ kinase